MEEKNTIYHYSMGRYEQLIPFNRREENLKQKSDHGDFLYFFPDPIPYKLVGKIFPKDHRYWVDGTVVFEHKVDVTAHDFRLKEWKVEETPEDKEASEKLMKYLHDLPRDDRFEELESEAFADFHAMKGRRRKSLGYTGDRLDTFLKMLRRFKGGTERAYHELTESFIWNNTEEGRYCAAPYVPHFGISTGDKPIKPYEIRMLEIGKGYL